MRPTLLLLPLAALLLPAQAPAPDKPAVQPIRDVTVEYKMMDSDGPDAPPRARQITVYWANGGKLMRIQMADDRYYVVINRNTNRMMMVLLDQHGYVEGPFDPKRQTGFTVPADLPLLRGESDIVAGNPCTLWNAKIGYGSSALCVTDDGVVLSAQGNRQDHVGDLTATSVIYGPQPATVFDPPPDFRKLDISSLSGGTPAATPGKPQQ